MSQNLSGGREKHEIMSDYSRTTSDGYTDQVGGHRPYHSHRLDCLSLYSDLWQQTSGRRGTLLAISFCPQIFTLPFRVP